MLIDFEDPNSTQVGRLVLLSDFAEQMNVDVRTLKDSLRRYDIPTHQFSNRKQYLSEVGIRLLWVRSKRAMTKKAAS